MSTFTIEASAICALLVAAGKKDIRYYLNGIHFNEKHAVATDGHRLAVYRLDTPVKNESVYPSIIIPREVFDAVKIKPKGLVTITLPDKITPESTTVTIDYMGVASTAALIDGKFPDYMRVVESSRTLSGEVAQFRADYLADHLKISKILKPSLKFHAPIIQYNGRGSAVVDFKTDYFFMILMPCDPPKGYEYEHPDWL